MTADAMGPGPVYAIPGHVYYNEVDDQMVLLNLETEEYYGLDAVGADMVSRVITEPWDLALAGLVSDYDVEHDRLTGDLHRLVAALSAAGLLERLHPPRPDAKPHDPHADGKRERGIGR